MREPDRHRPGLPKKNSPGRRIFVSSLLTIGTTVLWSRSREEAHFFPRRRKSSSMRSFQSEDSAAWGQARTADTAALMTS